MKTEVKKYLERKSVDFRSITIGTVFLITRTDYMYIKVTETHAFNINWNTIVTLNPSELCYVYEKATFCFNYEIENAQYKDTNVLTHHAVSKLRCDNGSFKEMRIGDIFITENHDMLNKPTDVNINNNIFVKIDIDNAFMYSTTGCEIINSDWFQNLKLFVLRNVCMELIE